MTTRTAIGLALLALGTVLVSGMKARGGSPVWVVSGTTTTPHVQAGVVWPGGAIVGPAPTTAIAYQTPTIVMTPVVVATPLHVVVSPVVTLATPVAIAPPTTAIVHLVHHVRPHPVVHRRMFRPRVQVHTVW
jgi:hypothetical protein